MKFKYFKKCHFRHLSANFYLPSIYLLLTLGSALTIQAQTVTYPFNFKFSGNPLVREHGASDPDVQVWGDTLWLYCSQDRNPFPNDPSGYSSMDGFHVFSTTDLINWTDHGEILHSKNISWGVPGFMWAPGAARKKNAEGKYIYYLYYPHKDKKDTWRIGIATSEKPQGPFTDIGAPMADISGIDPKIFFDDNGEAYIYNNNAIVAKLKPNMLELAEPTKNIIYGSTAIMSDSVQKFLEGSYMHKRNGKYYFSYTNWKNKVSQGFYAMGDSPYGPFEWKGAVGPAPQGAQDHHSIVEFKGRWYYFYHIAINGIPVKKEGQGRIACYDRLYYNDDGTMKRVVHTRDKLVDTTGTTQIIRPIKGFGIFNPGAANALTTTPEPIELYDLQGKKADKNLKVGKFKVLKSKI